jgi:hypothetical protein
VKRLLLSLLGGFLIPFAYSVAVGPLTPYIEDPRLNQLAMLPVRWPVMFIEHLFPLWWLSISWQQGQEVWLLFYIIICNVALYSAATYVLLWQFAKRKASVEPAPPPEPPSFEST